MTVAAITPELAKESVGKDIPDFVIESFNTLITKNLRGKRSSVKQDDVLALICSKTEISRSKILSNNWLDIEPIFRRAGWKVDYDQPGYCEDYPPIFIFLAP